MARTAPVMDSGISDIDASWTLDPSTIGDYTDNNGFSMGDVWSMIGSDNFKNLLNVGSGLYGLYEADKMKDMARSAYGASDPFGPYRAQYAKQLSALMADPNSITSDPGYQFQLNQGAEAVSRQMAAKGYLGSGNMGIALTEYGQNFGASYLDKKTRLLADLSGSGISPNFSSAIQGYASGIDTASKSLASLGYGSVMAGQPSKGTPENPNAAGGEAAKVGQSVSQVGGLLSKAGKVSGNSGLSSTGSYASNAGGVISGIAEGGVKGYGKAIGSASNLASAAGYGSTTTEVAGAVGDVASGNYIGAAKNLYSLYTGGAAAGGIAAGLGAGAGSGAVALGAAAPTVTGAAGLGTATAGSLFGTSASAATGAGAGSLGAAGGAGSLGAGTGAAAGSAGGAAGASALGAIGLFAAAWMFADAVNAKKDARSAAVTKITDQIAKANNWTMVNPKNRTYKMPDGRFIQVGEKVQKVAEALMNGDQDVADQAYKTWLDSSSTDYKTAVKGGS